MAQASRFQNLVADAKSRIREISASEAFEQHKDGAILIDVRESDDFVKEHAKDAIHRSRGVIELKIEELAPDIAAPIICYCGGGSRSAIGLNLSFLFDRQDLLGQAMRDLLAWANAGRFQPPQVTTFPLADVARAHQAIESSQTTGKLFFGHS